MAAASFLRHAVVLCAALAAALMVGGCATTVAAPAPICKPQNPQLLAALPDNVTYGELLKTYQAERKNLALCSLKASELAALITRCNAELEQFNQRLKSERDRNKSAL